MHMLCIIHGCSRMPLFVAPGNLHMALAGTLPTCRRMFPSSLVLGLVLGLLAIGIVEGARVYTPSTTEAGLFSHVSRVNHLGNRTSGLNDPYKQYTTCHLQTH
jgi:hypothetical protein